MARNALRISSDLALPLDWMSLATVVYGSRGSGKTTLGAVLAEEVTEAKQRFCAIDLKGDWYGLKSTADGKAEGIPVVVFGGDHADVPLEEGAGAFVGATVADLAHSCILDLEHLSKGRQIRFLKEFFLALYDRNREPLLLLADEAQRYAPQATRGTGGEILECLGAVEDVVKLGRKHGIGVVLFTQRGAGLNKEVSELCDLLVAFRTPGPLDQDRIKEWLDANTTKEQRDAVMGRLAGLPTGTAVFASGHPDLKLFGIHPVRRRWTFDSSATPKVGQRRTEPKKLAQPDLQVLRERMSAAIERARAENPKELRKRLAELDRELAKAKAVPAPEPPTPQVERIEVPMLSEAMARRLEGAVGKLETTAGAMLEVAREVSAALRNGHDRERAAQLALQPRPAARPQPVRAQRTARPETPARDETHKGQSSFAPVHRRILGALAELELLGVSAPRREIVALLSGYGHLNSKGLVNGLGTLKSAGLIDYPSGGLVALTVAGQATAIYPATPSTPREIQDRVIQLLGGATARILEPLIAAYPDSLEREALADQAGYGHLNSKGFVNALGRLRTLGFIDYPERGRVAAKPVLFLEN